MFLLALQIIIPLVIAALIGFVCAWLLRGHAVLKASHECSETRSRLEDISAQLQTFRQIEQQMSKPSHWFNACQSELRMLESELERLLGELGEVRKTTENWH